MNVLAELSVDRLLPIVLSMVVVGAIFWVCWWLIDYTGVPQPFAKVAKIIVAIFAAVLVIQMLISGNPIIKWLA